MLLRFHQFNHSVRTHPPTDIRVIRILFSYREEEVGVTCSTFEAVGISSDFFINHSTPFRSGFTIDVIPCKEMSGEERLAWHADLVIVVCWKIPKSNGWRP